jgi:hypothetical protein
MMSKALALCLIVCGLWIGISTRAAADPPAAGLSPEQIAAKILPVHPKTVVILFDVSMSTRTGGVFERDRAAAATIIRQGCEPGDRVVLDAFGAGHHVVFDATLTGYADASRLISQIPPSVEPGAGTDIRWPHHEALKLIAAGLPEPGVVVIMTDSFNDRPHVDDPAYAQYLDYYTLKGLTIYPHTPENADYERLLKMLKASGKLSQYGVGIGYAPNGRPIERLPLLPGEGDAGAASQSMTPIVYAPIGHEKPQSNLPIYAGIGALIPIVVVLALAAALNRPVAVRLKLGDRGTPRDFRLKPGSRIALGGPMVAARPGDDVFPLAGVVVPAAYVVAVRGGTDIYPAVGEENTTTLFHHGARLEKKESLRPGEEVRILVPAGETAPEREHRVHMIDPNAPLF